jgi:putative peptide zinc metalloprotease protein
MAQSQFSQLWYRVELLRPRLRSHVQVHRHLYRGQVWYVIQDHSTGRLHRFTPAAYFILGLMDGKRTVRDIWEAASAELADDTPTQDEMIQLLGQLHAADVLQCDVPPDTAEVLERYERQRRSERTRPLLSPMAIRIPLLDPERFLNACAPWLRYLFGWAGAALWIAVVGSAAVLSGRHWPELTQDVVDRVLAPQNLITLWLVFPVVKALHELGHAFAVKAWGGEVHEMGIMLLVLMPVPYVDASASSAFRDRRKRAVVGAAGMLVELFVAALALFVWLNVEPGVVRSVAYNVMLIAGVSTLMFNANPLLRFDGYYMLADMLEIPNLAQRSTKYLGYLTERYGFGLKDMESPDTMAGERAWLVFYAVASFIYRMIVMVAIILFVAGKFFFVGVILAIWGAATMLLLPLGRSLSALLAGPRLRHKRVRPLLVTGLAIAAVALFLLVLPVPLRTTAEGVVWVPEQSLVRAGTSGFVRRLIVAPGSLVRRGDAVAESYDPALAANIKRLEARVDELDARLTVERAQDRVQAQIAEEQLGQARAQLERSRERAGQLVMRSGADGMFVVPQAEDLPERFVHQGDLVGYVIDASTPTARVMVPQADIDLVRNRTRYAEVRLAERIGAVLPASILREVPAASEHLPSRALSTEGGGGIAVDPRDSSGTKTFSRNFEFDLVLPPQASSARLGSHVYVRFDHGREPLAWHWYRRIRQLFLARFDA